MIPNNFQTLKMPSLSDKLKLFASESSIHGLRFFVANESSKLKKLFWSIVLLLSVYNTVTIFQGSYNSYVNDSISFATDTSYLDWDTQFPAISVCEVWYHDKFGQILDKWDKNKSISFDQKTQLQEYLSEIVFFNGKCYQCTEKQLKSCKHCESFMNLYQINKQFRKSCEEIFKVCKWNNVKFNCCDHFLPLVTEFGECFIINSKHTEMKNNLNMISNLKKKLGHLNIIINSKEIMIHLHSPEDVPFINGEISLREKVFAGKHLKILFNVVEISNDKNVKNVEPIQRNCIFPEEAPTNWKVYKFYSYSTCIVHCRIVQQLQACNCTLHFMPEKAYSQKYCDIKGLQCLSANYDLLNRLRPKENIKKKGLACDCLPSCLEHDYNIVLKNIKDWSNSEEINIDIKMHSLPTQKFKRIVVRNFLDLFVSAGGTMNLFFGASVLSFVEIVYFLIIRKSNKTPKRKSIRGMKRSKNFQVI